MREIRPTLEFWPLLEAYSVLVMQSKYATVYFPTQVLLEQQLCTKSNIWAWHQRLEYISFRTHLRTAARFLHLKDALEETCHDSVQCGSSELGSYIAGFREVVLAMEPVCNRHVSNILPKTFIVITWF